MLSIAYSLTGIAAGLLSGVLRLLFNRSGLNIERAIEQQQVVQDRAERHVESNPTRQLYNVLVLNIDSRLTGDASKTPENGGIASVQNRETISLALQAATDSRDGSPSGEDSRRPAVCLWHTNSLQTIDLDEIQSNIDAVVTIAAPSPWRSPSKSDAVARAVEWCGKNNISHAAIYKSSEDPEDAVNSAIRQLIQAA